MKIYQILIFFSDLDSICSQLKHIRIHVYTYTYNHTHTRACVRTHTHGFASIDGDSVVGPALTVINGLLLALRTRARYAVVAEVRPDVQVEILRRVREEKIERNTTMRARTHAHAHIHTHTHTHTLTRICSHAQMHTHTRTHICVHAAHIRSATTRGHAYLHKKAARQRWMSSSVVKRN